MPKAARHEPKEVKKARRYDYETINQCFQFYLLYNGSSFERVAERMRETYPWFDAKRVGAWEQKYNWRESLKLKLEFDKKQALTSGDELVDETEAIRKKLFAELKDAGKIDHDLAQLHAKYVALSIQAQIKVREARDTLGAYLAFWERTLEWVKQFSPHAHEALLQVADDVMERAAIELGNPLDDGTDGQETNEDDE